MGSVGVVCSKAKVAFVKAKQWAKLIYQQHGARVIYNNAAQPFHTQQ